VEKGQIYFIRPYIGVEVGVGTGRITATTAAIRQDKPQALAIKLATGGLGPRFRRAPVRSPRQTGGGGGECWVASLRRKRCALDSM
jgi:hypothetical protein